MTTPRAMNYIFLPTSHCTGPHSKNYRGLIEAGKGLFCNENMTDDHRTFGCVCHAELSGRSILEHCALHREQLCMDCRYSARSCAASRQDRSIFVTLDLVVLRSVGVRSWRGNQAEGNLRRRVQNREHLFPGVHQKAGSARPPKHFGRARPQQSSPCARASLSAAPSSGYRASVSLPMKSSWSCSTKSAGVHATESRAKATKGKAGQAGVTGPVRRSTAGTGLRVGVSGAGLTATSEFMDVTVRRDGQPFFSSGAGLGIHEPGSQTSGGFFIAMARSGRARDRAVCPAVARSSFAGRADA